MESAIQIVLSGLTLGAMYAIGSIALSLLWGSLNMLNMAQGAMLAAGGYASYAAVVVFGWPPAFGLVLAVVVGMVLSYALYAGVIRFIIGTARFETAIIIATVGFAIVVENVILKLFGAYPFGQPLRLEGGIRLGGLHFPLQNLLIIVLAVTTMLGLAWLIGRTDFGRAVRATTQNREAARLMGVSVDRVFLAILLLSGCLSAFSGVLLSSLTTMSPTMGYDPMVKAFIICALAGLGSLRGTLATAFMLGIMEAAIQYVVGVRYGFPILLLVVIASLIWRPAGLFGRDWAARL